MERTPIYNALCSYSREKNLRLHMPGHVGGRAMPEEWAALARLDVTEIPGMDDFHMPQGVIAQSRRLLAQAVGAEESFFLVNGASSGIHALMMSVAGDGDKIIIPRNAHRSFYAGMVLSGAMPVYLPCEMDAELGIGLFVSRSELEDSLANEPDSKAVFLCSPNYYGICSDVRSLAEAAGRWDKMVLVDEAHGGHFPFHPDYPASALMQGAAAAVNGLHKTWPVFNQGAALHIGTAFQPRERLRQSISLLTTTSPSYPILASIELARNFMEQSGYDRLEKALQLSREYKAKINQIKGLKAYGEELIDGDKIIGLDPLKILISCRGLNLDGYQFSRILREQYHIQVEMDSRHMILGMFSLLHEKEDWQGFYWALKEIAGCYGCRPEKPDSAANIPESRSIISPRQAFLARKKTLLLEDSLGLIAGEMIAAYPPGIPCLVPGEMINVEILEYLYYLRDNKYHVHGPQDRQLKSIQVIEQS